MILNPSLLNYKMFSNIIITDLTSYHSLSVKQNVHKLCVALCKIDV